MSKKLKPASILTITLDEIIGREKELQVASQARKSLSNQDDTMLLYIFGAGGTGKTRLLDELIKSDTWREKNDIVGSNKIDFYDIEVHHKVELANQIYKSIEDRLDSEQSMLFEDYRAKFNDFQKQSFSGNEADEEQVNEAFHTAWRSLTKNRYCIIFMDTSEKLDYGQNSTEPIHLPLMPPEYPAFTWLQDVLQPSPLGVEDLTMPRTLVVVAGRETSRFSGRLKELATKERVIELKGLDLNSTDLYFKKLIKKLEFESLQNKDINVRSVYQENVKCVKSLIRSKQHHKLHEITQGLPVVLALATQLYVDNWHNPHIFEEIFKQFHKNNQSNSLNSSIKKELRKILVQNLLKNTYGDISNPFLYLALLRKGMTKKRLELLLKEDKDKCIEIINFLKKQIFIKELPKYLRQNIDDVPIVLHDEIADWIDSAVFENNLIDSREEYKRIEQVYDEEIKECENLIEGFLQDENNFMEQRRLRRRLNVEQMFYSLRADPVKGYIKNYLLQEEVFCSRFAGYGAQIRTEFNRWWEEKTIDNDTYRYQEEAKQLGITQSLIDADKSLRAIQNLYNQDDYEQVNRRCADELSSVSNQLAIHDTIKFFQIIAKGNQIAPTDANGVKELEKSFEDVLESLKGKLKNEKEDIHQTLVQASLAFGYYEYGYLQNILSKHGNAVIYFKESIKYYKKLKNKTEMSARAPLARSHNDLAFSAYEIGEMDIARNNIQEALRLRQQLGLRFPIALSLNTEAKIYASDPKTIIKSTEKASLAYKYFHSLSEEFWEAISLRTISECKRRHARYLESAREETNDQDKNVENLLLAAKNEIEKARKILDNSKKHWSFATKADIYDECACVYRDLCKLYLTNDKVKAADFEDMADKYFKSAYDYIAPTNQLDETDPYIRQLIDILVNHASLYYISKKYKETKSILDQIDQIDLIKKLLSSDNETYEKFKETGSVVWYYLVKYYVMKMELSPSNTDVLDCFLRIYTFSRLSEHIRPTVKHALDDASKKIKAIKEKDRASLLENASTRARELNIDNKYIKDCEKYIQNIFYVWQREEE